MDITLSKKETIETLQNIIKLLQNNNDQRFNYALIRNKKRLETEVKSIYKEIDVLEKKRSDTCIQYCKKDEKDKPVIVSGNYQGLEPGMCKEFDEFMDIYKKEKELLFDSEITIKDCYGIKEEYLPKVLNGLQQESLEPFVLHAECEKGIKLN